MIGEHARGQGAASGSAKYSIPRRIKKALSVARRPSTILRDFPESQLAPGQRRDVDPDGSEQLLWELRP